ncbi:uncharacterized protein LOC135945137 isoform X2 [Cloeon dipterum]|uniref:uncharacterized protein LOC135945137 isoform X2 n=1 Tax=Cloeon dipterum TaxID=197152 RepID=UPI00321FFCE1
MDRNEAVPTPRRNPPAQFNLSSLPVTPTVPEVSLLLEQNGFRPVRVPTPQGHQVALDINVQDALAEHNSPQPFRGFIQRPKTSFPVADQIPDEPSMPAAHLDVVNKAPNNYRTPPSFQHSPLVTSPATHEEGPPRHQGAIQVDYAANLMLNVEKRLLEQRVKELEEENRTLRERVERLESQQDSLQQVKMDALAEQTAACLRLLENLNARKVQFERSTQTDEPSATSHNRSDQEEFYDDALRAMQGLFPPRDVRVEQGKEAAVYDTSYLPRVLPVATPEASPRVTDISAHMNQLALKHLNLNSPSLQVDRPQQPCMTYYNNLSMSTKQFLEKLKVTPGQQAQILEEDDEAALSPSQKGSTDKILDITAIKRQNKLL